MNTVKQEGIRMTTHTPGPWTIERDTRFIGTRWVRIAEMQYHGPRHEEELRANAAFIVLACNAHEDLVAALRDVQQFLVGVAETEELADARTDHIARGLDDALDTVEAAIAKAAP